MATFALLLAACGPSKGTTRDPASSGPDPRATEVDGVDGTGVLASCTHPQAAPATCAEAPLSASHGEARCTRAGGRFRRGPCEKASVLATCRLSSKKAALYLYPAADEAPQATGGRLDGMKGSCELQGGVFQSEVPSRTVSCPKGPLCLEVTVTPASDVGTLEKAVDLCKRMGAANHDGGCSTRSVTAECSFEADDMPLHFVTYAQSDARTTEEAVAALERMCKKRTGVFTAK